MATLRLVAFGLPLVMLTAACGETWQQRSVTGAGVGAGTGAVAGALIKGISPLGGALIGGLVGAGVGAATSRDVRSN